MQKCEIAVIGGGAAGLIAAILLAKSGFSVASLFPKSKDQIDETRTTALMQGSVEILENIGVWQELSEATTPLEKLKIIDNTNHTIKACNVEFNSSELSNKPFGWNVPLNILINKLENKLINIDNVKVFKSTKVDDIIIQKNYIDIIVKDKKICQAKLLIAADGKNSLCRKKAGIKSYRVPYNQAAIATSFTHELDHNNTSIEFHKPIGPFTTVPMPGKQSSLVWSETINKANHLIKMSDEEFKSLIQKYSNGILGNIIDVGPRNIFHLETLIAKQFAKDRIILVGESAHVLPPIGAQGLNLGIRDSALIAKILSNNKHIDISNEKIITEYDKNRRLDIVPRSIAADLLNRSLFSQSIFLQGARALGMLVLDNFPTIRKNVMRYGIKPLNEY